MTTSTKRTRVSGRPSHGRTEASKLTIAVSPTERARYAALAAALGRPLAEIVRTQLDARCDHERIP